MEVAVVLCSNLSPVSLSMTLMMYAMIIPLVSRGGGGSHSKTMLE